MGRRWGAEKQSRDLEKQSMLRVGAVTEARRERSYLTVKKRRACPEGTPLRSCGRCSSVSQGICCFWAKGSDTRRRRSSLRASWPLKNCSCVVCDRRELRLLRHSSGGPLHQSKKPGPKGRRVVHVLPSMGKQFFQVLVRRKPTGGGWAHPEPADWLHGQIPGSRRESAAVLIRQVTTWRLERFGLKSPTAFHDLTNAFGSVKWEAMDRAVASLLGPNALIGQ